jgi:hypothetical protein
MSEPTTSTQDAALARAHAEGIRIARLGEDTFRAQSSEPHLRGPYLIVGAGAEAVCQCLGGAFREDCKHRALLAEALAGRAPWSDVSEIQGPPAGSAPRRETPAERHARQIAEYDAAAAARRASPAATVTAADYEMFG